MTRALHTRQPACTLSSSLLINLASGLLLLPLKAILEEQTVELGKALDRGLSTIYWAGVDSF